MKKKLICALLSFSVLATMTGYSVKADDVVSEEESIVQPYEYQHRDIGEPVYREVADAFAELYELENILVMDAGRYGFVKLQYYTENQGFDNVYTFTDCRSLFEDLWVEWLDTKLYLMAKGTPLLEKGYKGIFESLPEEKKKELMDKKADFAKKAGIEL